MRDELREALDTSIEPSEPPGLLQAHAQQCRKLIREPLLSHAQGCWAWGPAHYLCALRRIRELEG